jgi:hypothetical protein
MGKVTIAGNSYVVTSTVSRADLEMVKKYRPDTLKIVDDETKEVLFRVSIGSDSVSGFGISFGGVSNDDDKLATATLPIPHAVEDAKEYVIDIAGLALTMLEKVEGKVADVLKDIKADHDVIAESIVVIA